MKRSAAFLAVALGIALSAYLAPEVAAAEKPAGKTGVKTVSDVGTESEIYGPMTVRAVPKAARPTDRPVDEKACFECHDEIKALKEGGKHARNNCTNCHDGAADHLKDEGRRPATRVDLETCGGCHPDQYSSLNTLNLKKPARTEKSLLTERSPNPYWDKLMMGHGFTKEHANPRSHAYMLLDQFVVDRAFGGRFQPKSGWGYVSMPGPVKVWDVLEDKYPGNTEHKAFLPESAAAANPTCMQCKTQDQILKWKYLGDKDGKAKWDRTSNVVEFVKELNNGMNCFICHDPHAAKPRIVRDGLIQALTRPEKDTLWHKDPKATGIEVKEFRDGYRKIALLEKYDTNLLCGQCHVEYNCNPGFDPKTGEYSITAADRRTNHFPFKNVLSIYDHYDALGFRDFRHALTGGLLWKAQHPEAETYWNSVHHKAGAGCGACHMPKVKNARGKVYTSHWQTSPKNYLKQTCLTSKCHPKLTEHQAIYEIESIRNYTKGRMRKAEFWLSELIDRIVEGKKAGLPADVIREAQERHQKAHILWEWWTAENSDGFHNPALARESLTRSVEESRKGIRLIGDAMGKKAAAK
ncbi:MAG: ammonia-forming cytochrome c nitrite reductase subunit c552 [Deltaproteobacteria bacterium]|nr:ammonia-forming cytochrome c nitrite reductase subunit c552 [Deltaproteobacteria bacterium]